MIRTSHCCSQLLEGLFAPIFLTPILSFVRRRVVVVKRLGSLSTYPAGVPLFVTGGVRKQVLFGDPFHDGFRRRFPMISFLTEPEKPATRALRLHRQKLLNPSVGDGARVVIDRVPKRRFIEIDEQYLVCSTTVALLSHDWSRCAKCSTDSPAAGQP